MAHVVLFHSILGRRPAEHRLAEAFEAAGHTVSVPDLYGGRVAEGYEACFALKDAVGDEAILVRATVSLADAPDDAVLAGISFGAFLIGRLWADRPHAAGALLIAGVAEWMQPPRPGFPVEAHVARPDPFDPEDVFETWLAQCGAADATLWRYDGAGHYFLDEDLPDHDAVAAELCVTRAKAFLERLG